jgi:dephospho-CoA kinase
MSSGNFITFIIALHKPVFYDRFEKAPQGSLYLPVMSKILTFVGMPGSGVTTASSYVSAKGYPRVYFGGVIYDEMQKAGIEITAESQARFREHIRQERGNDFVVNIIIEQITRLKDAGQHLIVADSVYSWTEYKALKRAFPGEVIVVAVLAPRRTRHRRLAQRPERPFTAKEATDRDWSEIENLEKGGPIAAADHFISNDADLETFYTQIDAVLRAVDFT